MSMISALIDELNKSADEWNSSNMFELARMCRSAADTITELRGALQVASVDYRHLSEENAKLRERGARLFDKTLELGTENEKLQASNEVIAEDHAALCEHNAKLRELVKALLTCATDGDCDECRLNGATPWHVGKAQLCDGVWDRVRKLGVEVDG